MVVLLVVRVGDMVGVCVFTLTGSHGTRNGFEVWPV